MAFHSTALSLLLAAIKPASGARLCDALTAADLQRIGIAVDKMHDTNIDDPASAHCNYRVKSGAAGVGLNVFFPTDAIKTEGTALGESSGNYVDAHIKNVDDSRIQLNDVSAGLRFASLIVRKNDLVYIISIPSGPHAESQLRALSKVVLQRLMP
jgi:hypothetical protein